MYLMYLINSAKNREELSKLGFDTSDLNNTDYLYVDIINKEVASSTFILTYPIFEAEHVAALMVLPDYQSRVSYLLSEKIITGFNAHVPRELMQNHWRMVNSRTYPAPQG